MSTDEERQAHYGCTEACPGRRVKGLCMRHYQALRKDINAHPGEPNRYRLDSTLNSVVALCRIKDCKWRSVGTTASDAEGSWAMHYAKDHTWNGDTTKLVRALDTWLAEHPTDLLNIRPMGAHRSKPATKPRKPRKARKARATCMNHPDRPAMGRGLCDAEYRRVLYWERKAREEAAQ